MEASANRFALCLSLAAFLLPLPPRFHAQSSAFVGTAKSSEFVGIWQQADWNDPNGMGLQFRIVQSDFGLTGSVHFRDARGEHQADMLNPELRRKALLFRVDDDYFGQKLTFSMNIQKGGNTALVQSWSGDMFSDFIVVKQP